MTECLDEETILAFCRGDVVPGRRPSIEKHIGECDECRALVSAVARSSLVDPQELFESPLPPRGDTGRLGAEPQVTDATTPAQGGFGPSGSLPKPRSKPPISPVQPGDVLAGKFAVERVLGVGGMGVVVAARHTQLDQTVALKFLLPSACEAQGAIARFLREGKAAARITSEHVARVSDTGVLDNGSPYLVMEYLDGSDLGELTHAQGPLDPRTAVGYVLQACEAIVEAHQLGIVHRDLKPANLFLSRRKDGSPLVKVLDFGISKAEGGSQTQLTSTSMLMGSPRYMSPEQMVSAKDVDLRTDIWALGIILFELIAGRPVWQADTVQGLCALIATAKTPSLRQFAPLAPAALEDVINRCLAKSLVDRVQSVADLVILLEPVAPPESKVSIDRVLAMSGRGRGHGPGPLPPNPIPIAYAPRSSPDAGAEAMAATAMASSSSTTPTRSSSSSSSSAKIAVLLAIVIGVLVVIGVALNTIFVKKRSQVQVDPGPPVAASSVPVIAASSPPPAASSSSSSSSSALAVPVIDSAATAPRASALAGKPTAPRPRHSASGAASRPADLPPPDPNRALSDRK